MDDDDLESSVEYIISAIYAFESIWQWDRAVLGVEEVVNLLVWGKVRIGNNTRLFRYSSSYCHSDMLLCAFADEGVKESSIWYPRAVRVELWLCVCVCVCVCAVPPA